MIGKASIRKHYKFSHGHHQLRLNSQVFCVNFCYDYPLGEEMGPLVLTYLGKFRGK